MMFNIIYLLIILFVTHIILSKSNFIAKKLKIIDLPNKQSIHNKPIPKTGGIVIASVIIINFLFLNIINDWEFLNIVEFFSIISVFIVGLMDDVLDLKPSLRIFFLSIITFILTYTNQIFLIEVLNFQNFGATSFLLGSFSLIFTIFCIVVFCNSFNFIDGINGLAISVSLIWIILIPLELNEKFSIIFCLIYILINNVRNKIFLGNSGSLILSFYIAIKFVEYYNKDQFLQADQIFICFLIPGLDLIRLFFERISNKKSPFSGDLNHLHHLLINYLSSKNKSLVIYLFLVLIPIIASVFFEIKSLEIIITTIILYLILIFFLKKN